ncbi:MAG TPA: NUDIX domain-containing protein [Gaiellaceae bacterium]
MLHGWRFCPRCGAEVEGAPDRVECQACGYVVYANPAPTASALVVDEQGRILLARRAAEVEHGKWDLPGGFVDEDEHPLDATVRELAEETGLEIEPERLFGIWMDRYGGGTDARSTLNLYWLARAVGGEPRAADDVSELRWFAKAELPPEEEIAFTNVAEVLAAWRDEHA